MWTWTSLNQRFRISQFFGATQGWVFSPRRHRNCISPKSSSWVAHNCISIWSTVAYWQVFKVWIFSWINLQGRFEQNYFLEKIQYNCENIPYMCQNCPNICLQIFKIFVGEYSKYGYSADSICEDALDKIFVVAANKYELTPKWFCFGSYLVFVLVAILYLLRLQETIS